MVRSLAVRGVELQVGHSPPSAKSRFSRFTESFTRLPAFASESAAHLDFLGEAIERTGYKVLAPCFGDVALSIRRRARSSTGVRRGPHIRAAPGTMGIEAFQTPSG